MSAAIATFDLLRESFPGQPAALDPRGRPLAPTPPMLPILGHMRIINGDRTAFLCEWVEALGDVVRFRFGTVTAQLFAHPDAVQHIMVDANKRYNKRTRGYQKLKEFLGEGLLTSDGAFWLRQRRIAQPAFHRKRIASFGKIMTRDTHEMLNQWKRQASPISVSGEMMALTLRIVSESLLGSDTSGESHLVAEAVEVMLREAVWRINRPFNVPPHWPTPRNRRFQRAAKTLDDIVFGMIRARRQGKERRDDLLQMLLEAEDADTKERMNDQQLRDETMTMFLAGHETTANALTWALYLVSKYPEVGRKLHEECAAVLGPDGVATLEDLPKLPYAKQVIQESMRLLPPVWTVGRGAEVADEVAGYYVPKDSLVLMSPYVTHRHPDFWENPEGFDPERFTPERVKNHHRCQYFPFAVGPRMCIGAGFALFEAQLVLASIYSTYRLELLPGQQVIPETMITLRPRYPMMMRAKRWDSA